MSWFLFLLLTLTGGSAFTQVQYIGNAISAADHRRKQPLQDALDAGFAGVSVDVTLNKDGKLKCGSGLFDELYLKPLEKRIDLNKGWVYPDKPEEFLLILRINGDSIRSFNALHSMLEAYPGILTKYTGTVRSKKAVKVIISGEIPRKELSSKATRFCTTDEPIQSMAKQFDGTVTSMATLNFAKEYNWSGDGNMTNTEFYSLTTFVKLAHKAGRIVRVSRLPEKKNAFNLLAGAGVDFFEVTDIENFITYFRNK